MRRQVLKIDVKDDRLWSTIRSKFLGTSQETTTTTEDFGNCEEELPKKPVGRLSVNCRPTVGRQSTDS